MSTLTLANLTKQFGDVTAVSDVNIEVGDGELLCILGPSGCGKSTALRMVGGFELPTSGDILIDGQSVAMPCPLRCRRGADWRAGLVSHVTRRAESVARIPVCGFLFSASCLPA